MNKEEIKQWDSELQDCLTYCREQNGMNECKNCGLSPEMIDQARTSLLAEIEGKIAETVDDYFDGLLIIPAPELTKDKLKEEILKVIREMK